MIKGKLTIGNPAHTCYVCGEGALFNVKNIKSYNEAGWGGGKVVPALPEELVDYILTNCPTILKYRAVPFGERKNIPKYRIISCISNELIDLIQKKQVPKSSAEALAEMRSYEQFEVFAIMLKTLVFINKKAYYRKVKSFNKKMEKRNSKPRTYPTCWYVCSEECLNMLILQKS